MATTRPLSLITGPPLSPRCTFPRSGTMVCSRAGDVGVGREHVRRRPGGPPLRSAARPSVAEQHHLVVRTGILRQVERRDSQTLYVEVGDVVGCVEVDEPGRQDLPPLRATTRVSSSPATTWAFVATRPWRRPSRSLAPRLRRRRFDLDDALAGLGRYRRSQDASIRLPGSRSGGAAMSGNWSSCQGPEHRTRRYDVDEPRGWTALHALAKASPRSEAPRRRPARATARPTPMPITTPPAESASRSGLRKIAHRRRVATRLAVASAAPRRRLRSGSRTAPTVTRLRPEGTAARPARL